jgi:hypothetical protein
LGPAVAAVVKKYAQNVWRLELYVYDFLLEQIITPFRSLTKLKAVGQTGHGLRGLQQHMDVLCSAPTLVKCEFLSMCYVYYVENNIPTLLTHPCLRHLQLGELGVTCAEISYPPSP